MAIVMLRGTTMGTRLLVLFIIARFASPAEFGVISFALAVAEIVKGMADFGVDTFAIRELALREGEQQEIFASIAAATKLFTGLIAYPLLVLFFLLQNKSHVQLGAELGLLVLTGLWCNMYIDYFQARLRVREIVAPVIVNNVATVIVAAAVFWIKPTVNAGVLILPLSEAFNAWVLSRQFNRELLLARQYVSFREVRLLLRRSMPIAGTLIISMVYTRLDVFALTVFLDATIVGYYGVAFRLTEPFQLLAIAFASSSYSYLSLALANNRQDISRLVIRYSLGMLGYGLVSCALLAVLAPYVIQRVLPNYVPAIPILRVLAAAIVFRAVNGYLTSVLHAYGYFARVTAVATWNLLVIVVALLALVPPWGAIGAALSLLIGEMINTIIQASMARRALWGGVTKVQPMEIGSA
jgi:O-antigen/teichoic acid export membrane protein